MAAFAFTILFVVVLTFILYWLINYIKLKRVIDKIQGPRAYPLIGNVHQFRNDADGNFVVLFDIIASYSKQTFIQISGIR